MSNIKLEKLKEVQAAIPHREPFLFVDEIVECNDKHIICKKTFTGQEDFFRGHYPNAPLVPGVLQCEAALQAGAILLTRLFEDEKMTGRMPVVAKIGEVRFKQMVKPGDTIVMEVKFREKMTGVYFLRAKVTKNDKTCVQFDFACALTDSIDGAGVK
ncbi:MAG: 3-hydroxyacyl-ACP dehydratase FabZ [Planctomycetaceae bacterium]|jgi:3-hydroxyacyl-[acyl-carrier-protein] dehydratase|nr:3-hydroxyacyl-ACP dehydratase FabZ [Planctomycetaceae bacterium]